jgi:hypothetical protein
MKTSYFNSWYKVFEEQGVNAHCYRAYLFLALTNRQLEKVARLACMQGNPHIQEEIEGVLYDSVILENRTILRFKHDVNKKSIAEREVI